MKANHRFSMSGLIFKLFMVLVHSQYTFASEKLWMDQDYDFIVVGAGAAGAALASRLSEDPNYNVLLLEAGGEPLNMNSIPYFSLGPVGGRMDWHFLTEKQEHGCLKLKDQKMILYRGKGLGGSTLINAMVYTRGNKRDYDHWASLGNPGWSFEDVLPFFKKLEDYQIPLLQSSDEKYHGFGGPVSVSRPAYKTQIADAFLEAGKEMGYDQVDYNAGSQTGFSNPPFALKNGSRCSTYHAYLEPFRHRSNFHIVSQAFVTKILFDETRRAVGVLFEKNGKLWKATCNKEVIVSAGAAMSPHLLMLSGIGPQEVLKQFEIPLIQHLPGVGKNLGDHVGVLGLVSMLPPNVGFSQKSDVTPETMEMWETKRIGPLTVPFRSEGIGFLNSPYADEKGDFPDFEIEIVQFPGVPVNLDTEIFDALFRPEENKEVLLVIPILLRPQSLGYTTLRSANPHDPPIFQPNYLLENIDNKVLIEAVKSAHRLMTSEAFTKLGGKPLEKPLPGCENEERNTDAFWACLVRHYSFGYYHPSGSCKMGPASDSMAVVDSQLRVYGTKGLRVADLSISPTIISAHTMVPAIMIGEKAASMILNEWKPSHEEL